jgi:hypothetical protein
MAHSHTFALQVCCCGAGGGGVIASTARVAAILAHVSSCSILEEEARVALECAARLAIGRGCARNRARAVGDGRAGCAMYEFCAI